MMSWVYAALARIRALFARKRLDRQLEDQLDAHIAFATEDNIEKGMTPEAARREALLKLGSRDLTRELHSEARGLPLLETLARDVAYGARQLRRNPLVTFTTVLTLAIAIGASTTIFTLAEALLFRDPAGVDEPGRLVDIGVSHKGVGFGSNSYPNYVDIAGRATSFDGIYAHTRFPNGTNLAGPGGPLEPVFVMETSTNFFTVLGVKPAMGRVFDRVERDAAVLSYGYWKRRFNRDPSVIGRTLQLNGRPFAVIGVAAESFHGTGVRAPDIWTPLRVNDSRVAGWLVMGGRLKHGVSRSQAAAELNVIGRVLQAEYPIENKEKDLRVAALSPLPGESLPVAGFLALLMAIVMIVLAIACANVSGVLLARASARRQEIAVRLAIGAGRSRIVRQLLTETVLLFAISAVTAIALARGMTLILVSQLPNLPFPIDLTVSLDWRIVAFAMALSFVAALMSGLTPAFQASRRDVLGAIKSDETLGPGQLGRLRLRNAFVVTQVALSVWLVVVAGLFVRALLNASVLDAGFDLTGVELASINLREMGYDAATGAVHARDLVQQVRRAPGVEAATIATVIPGGFEGIGLGGLSVAGVLPPDGEPYFSPTWNVIEPDYFATIRMPLLDGRDFNANDLAGTPPVVILGEGAARKFWPGQRAVGNYVEMMRWTPGSQTPTGKKLLVVGVARDPKFGSLVDGSSNVFAYLPLQQEHLQVWTMVVARSTDGQPLTGVIRSTVETANPNVIVESSQAGADYAALGLAPWRIAASVSGTLGVVGLLVAGIGIYGVTAYVITRRTREIGIRIALGARRENVIMLIVKQGMGLVLLGGVIGLLVAAGAALLLKSFLFGAPALDPLIFSAATLLFMIIGLLACVIPASRATRIDPINALRNE